MLAHPGCGVGLRRLQAACWAVSLHRRCRGRRDGHVPAHRRHSLARCARGPRPGNPAGSHPQVSGLACRTLLQQLHRLLVPLAPLLAPVESVSRPSTAVAGLWVLLPLCQRLAAVKAADYCCRCCWGCCLCVVCHLGHGAAARSQLRRPLSVPLLPVHHQSTLHRRCLAELPPSAALRCPAPARSIVVAWRSTVVRGPPAAPCLVCASWCCRFHHSCGCCGCLPRRCVGVLLVAACEVDCAQLSGRRTLMPPNRQVSQPTAPRRLLQVTVGVVVMCGHVSLMVAVEQGVAVTPAEQRVGR